MTKAKPKSAPNLDVREQLWNQREQGPANQISRSEQEVIELHGILLDLDRAIFRPVDEARMTRRAFWETIREMLDRDPLLSKAEVRSTGGGLHVIVRMDPAADLATDAAKEKWRGIVAVIQSMLPTDPDAPGLHALTRPVHATNTKFDPPYVVKLLRDATPVSPVDVERAAAEFLEAPFERLARTLFGSDRISPCPICKEHDSTMRALARRGECYGRCGKVSLEQLFDRFLRPRPKAKGGQ